MSTRDDDQNPRGRAAQFTQTLVLSPPPPEQAAPDLRKTHYLGSMLPEGAPPAEAVDLAKTQLLPVDLVSLRARSAASSAAIVPDRPGSNDGKTQILWADQFGARHPLAKTQPISATVIVEARRRRGASRASALGDWIRHPMHIRAAIAGCSVVLACYATWNFTARPDVTTGSMNQPRVAATSTAARTSASAPVTSKSYAVSAPAEPPSTAAVGVMPTTKQGSMQNTERAAVDALYTGDYRLAAQHYAALAEANPHKRVYVEALSILRSAASAATDTPRGRH